MYIDRYTGVVVLTQTIKQRLYILFINESCSAIKGNII